MLHLHLASIVIAVILFAVIYVSYKRDNSKDNKLAFILHMVNRVFYVIILFSGLVAYIQLMDPISGGGMHMEYGIKILLGLFTIAFLEIAVVRLKKGSSKATTLGLIAVIALIATISMGVYLPFGTF